MLHTSRRNLKPIELDQFLDPIRDEAQPPLIHIPNISCPKPPITRQSLPRCLLVIQIPLEDIGSSHPELADFVETYFRQSFDVHDLSLDVRRRTTDRANANVPLIPFLLVCSRRSLAKTKGLLHGYLESVVQQIDEIFRQRRGSGYEHLETAEVVIGDGGIFGEGENYAGDDVVVGYSVGLDEIEEGGEREGGEDEEFDALMEGVVEDAGETFGTLVFRMAEVDILLTVDVEER